VRIAFVLSGLGAGGAEKVVNLVARHRQGCGDRIDILAVNAERPDSYFPYDHDTGLWPLRRRQRRGMPLPAAARQIAALRRRLAALSPDLVISFLTKINVLAALATVGLDAPLILSERNNFTTQTMSPVWRVARPLAARRAARLVMQTEAARMALPPGLRNRAVVIPNPVAVPDLAVTRAGDGARFVAVGRLDPQKGFDLLLAAFARVVRQIPVAQLTIFGEGPQRAALERQAIELGIGDQVSLPGITQTPGEWVGAGDIFVLSSRYEGFPNVLIEAMTAGLATIAFDCPWGPSEILATSPDSGLLVPSGDVEKLGDAMLHLAIDPALRHHIAAAGAQAAATHYSMPAVLAQWDAVIADAVTAPRVPA
jgi:glycosyltransferase involved in cell wall biosynthesis